MEDVEIGPSILGTQNHWKEAYQHELNNFKEHGDYGQIWFGSDSISRIIKWMNSSDTVHKEDSVVDLGCGNGTLLLQLAKDGYTNLTGVDYIEEAIELAKSIAFKENADITFKVGDILHQSDLLGKDWKFQVVLDKGTYDAISLSPDDSESKRNLYKKNVHELLQSDGLFIISSCNWTSDELKLQFPECLGFKFLDHIPFPTFQFGGKTGSSVTSLVFQNAQEL